MVSVVQHHPIPVGSTLCIVQKQGVLFLVYCLKISKEIVDQWMKLQRD